MKSVTLCTHHERRDGEVTVGTALGIPAPASEVLGTVRAFGVAGAAAVWPQLTEDELSVMERLVRDVDEGSGVASAPIEERIDGRG